MWDFSSKKRKTMEKIKKISVLKTLGIAMIVGVAIYNVYLALDINEDSDSVPLNFTEKLALAENNGSDRSNYIDNSLSCDITESNTCSIYFWTPWGSCDIGFTYNTTAKGTSNYCLPSTGNTCKYHECQKNG
jgi:hypothetical protein